MLSKGHCSTRMSKSSGSWPCEMCGGVRKGKQGLFASKSAIWREGDELLKKVAIPLLVDKDNCHKVLELGNTVQLEYERLIRLIIPDNELTDIAKFFSIAMGFSLDAADMTQLT